MPVLLDKILVCVLRGEECSTGSLPQATDGGAWQDTRARLTYGLVE
jgi:hypothetical protein